MNDRKILYISLALTRHMQELAAYGRDPQTKLLYHCHV